MRYWCAAEAPRLFASVPGSSRSAGQISVLDRFLKPVTKPPPRAKNRFNSSCLAKLAFRDRDPEDHGVCPASSCCRGGVSRRCMQPCDMPSSQAWAKMCTILFCSLVTGTCCKPSASARSLNRNQHTSATGTYPPRFLREVPSETQFSHLTDNRDGNHRKERSEARKNKRTSA